MPERSTPTRTLSCSASTTSRSARRASVRLPTPCTRARITVHDGHELCRLDVARSSRPVRAKTSKEESPPLAGSSVVLGREQASSSRSR